MIKKDYKLSLFIFRRDLRLQDNTGLLAALKQSVLVIPCFIFDPRQSSAKNHYKSDNSLQFMIESLIELDSHLKKRDSKLITPIGLADKVVENLLQTLPIDAVFINKDSTPF